MDPRRWLGATCWMLVTGCHAAEPVPLTQSEVLSMALDSCLANPPPVVRNLELEISEQIHATSDDHQQLASIILEVSAPGRPHVRGQVVCHFDDGKLVSSELITLRR